MFRALLVRATQFTAQHTRDVDPFFSGQKPPELDLPATRAQRKAATVGSTHHLRPVTIQLDTPYVIHFNKLELQPVTGNRETLVISGMQANVAKRQKQPDDFEAAKRQYRPRATHYQKRQPNAERHKQNEAENKISAR